MINEATLTKVLRARAIANELGFRYTSYKLKPLPDCIERFKKVTDPTGKLIHGNYLITAADSAETAFNQDLGNNQEVIQKALDLHNGIIAKLKASLVRFVIADVCFAAITIHCAISGTISSAVESALLISAAALNILVITVSANLVSSRWFLKEGPKYIEEAIKELKEELKVLTGKDGSTC
ncbi:MAG: hypothetical protein PHF60_05690 [Candidatus ainarchaeum sp.]|nr:hypothetical protein [Candidatus ainarchaeum sp.]